MVLAAKLDEYGRGGWIAATVIAFWAFWPLGLALLAFLIFSGRLSACGPNGAGRWHNMGHNIGHNMAEGRGGCGWGHRGRRAQRSGNAAFDDYRAETLRRLEEEQQEFVAYLERLRRAKDKAEFDQFMADRRTRPHEPEAPQAGA